MRILSITGLFIVSTLFSFALLLLTNSTSTTSAADGANFKPGRIIDDYVFYDNNSMTSSQIQSFLNARMQNCDTNGTGAATEWGRPDISRATLASYFRNGTNGYTKDTGFHAPPYTCLKNYTQNTPQMESASGLCSGISAKTNRTSALIIKDIANACGISPQVLLVLLQKEQSLVTDNWPLDRQYESATGFACPDTAPCDPAFDGFFYQVYYAARQFKIYQAYPSNYNYRAGQTNNIYWHPDLARCGSSNVYIENQATAALYIYTPYRPNQAALNNLYGTGDSCSSYGNRNFWRLFTDWFGNPAFALYGAIGAKFTGLDGSTGLLGSPKTNEICIGSPFGCHQTFVNGRIYWSPGTGARVIIGGVLSRYISLDRQSGFLGYPTSDEQSLASGGVFQEFQKGRVYWKAGIGAWSSHGGSLQRYLLDGGDSGPLGYPTEGETINLDGGTTQQYENGRIYWQRGVGAWTVQGPILARYTAQSNQRAILGYPTENQRLLPDGTVSQQFEKGRIYWNSSSGALVIRGGVFFRYVAAEGESGPLGYPISEETGTQDGGAKQEFENGSIYWKRGVGAWSVQGTIFTNYEGLGAQTSFLGYPVSSEQALQGSGIYQQFEKGRIYWKSETGSWSVHGGIGSRYILEGAESGALGYPLSGETSSPEGGVYQDFENGRILWKAGLGTTVELT